MGYMTKTSALRLFGEMKEPGGRCTVQILSTYNIAPGFRLNGALRSISGALILSPAASKNPQDVPFSHVTADHSLTSLNK